jgi:hypothetical protein
MVKQLNKNKETTSNKAKSVVNGYQTVDKSVNRKEVTQKKIKNQNHISANFWQTKDKGKFYIRVIFYAS